MAKTLILGAGPAGTSCAISLLAQGHEVTLVDRVQFPRHAPGETFHPGIEPILSQLGVFDQVAQHCQVRHKGIEVLSGGKSRIDYFNEAENWRGIQIRRQVFDQLLLDQAKAMGAAVHLGEKAMELIREEDHIKALVTDRTTYEADFFVDASGRSRWISRMLGAGTEMTGPTLIAHYGYYEEEAEMALPRFEYESEGSWLWHAQIEQGLYNWTYTTENKGLAKDWVHPKFVDKDHLEKHVLDVTWRLNQAPAKANYYAVGDAAFTTDPSTSHGVLKALMSGIMAASHIASGRSHLGGAQAYGQWISDWFHSDARKIEEMRAL